MRELIIRFDQRISGIVTMIPDSFRPMFLTITSLGDPIITIGIGIVVAGIGWMQHSFRLFLSGAVVWLTLLAGSGLKLLFSRERPMTEYSANLRVDTFSFPSGHSSGAMIAYGLVAYLLWHVLPQPWNYIVAVMCALLIIAIGVSRVYLGAHFPSDVLAGWLLGGLALGIIIFYIKPLS